MCMPVCESIYASALYCLYGLLNVQLKTVLLVLRPV